MRTSSAYGAAVPRALMTNVLQSTSWQVIVRQSIVLPVPQPRQCVTMQDANSRLNNGGSRSSSPFKSVTVCLRTVLRDSRFNLLFAKSDSRKRPDTYAPRFLR